MQGVLKRVFKSKTQGVHNYKQYKAYLIAKKEGWDAEGEEKAR